MATEAKTGRCSEADLVRMLLARSSDSVALELTVPASDQGAPASALGLDSPRAKGGHGWTLC
jgi:hypothetical protein